MRKPRRDAGSSVIRHQTVALALICLLAITLRIVYRAYMGGADFWQNGYGLFYEIAKNIVAGKGLWIDGGGWAFRPRLSP